MIQVKLGDIYTSTPVIELLIKEKLSIKTLYKFNKLIEALQKELKFVEDRRLELIKKYGLTNEDGNIQVKNDSIEDFNKDLLEMLDIEVELQADKFTKEELDNLTLNYIDFVKIKNFIQ
jgi:hypothetical protein